jgi:outer membrane biosynthesis protein TonB
VRAGKRLKPSETDPEGAVARSHICTCTPLLALTLLATLGSATAMADASTCKGWFDASDNSADKIYTATLMKLIPADMPMNQVDRFVRELALECSKHGQYAFASTARQVLQGLDRPQPSIEDVVPTSQVAVTPKPTDPEVTAPKPQIQETAPEPQAPPAEPKVRDPQAKVKGHHHGHAVHTRQTKAAHTLKPATSASVRTN